jgi:O-succinylhomoserine sulfhydrylase
MLAAHKAVKNVRYPGLTNHPQHDLARKQMTGFGSIIAFEINGGEAAAYRVLNELSLIDISNNLGDSKSLACHPYTTTHSSLSDEELAALGISTSHLRLSVGLESVHDLVRDVEQALGILG